LTILLKNIGWKLWNQQTSRQALRQEKSLPNPSRRPLKFARNGFYKRRNTRKKSEKTLKSRVSAGEYLAFLSVKYEVDPDVLFNALVSAGENRKSKCGNLSVERRGETQDRVVFLIL